MFKRLVEKARNGLQAAGQSLMTCSAWAGRGVRTAALACWSLRYTIAGSLLLWILLGGYMYCTPDFFYENRYWLEVVNGATWPDRWTDLYSASKLGFAAAVSARTLINIAGPLAIVAAVINVRHFLENRMRMSFTEFVRLHDAEVLLAVQAALESMRPELRLQPDEKQRLESIVAMVGTRLATGIEITFPERQQGKSAGSPAA